MTTSTHSAAEGSDLGLASCSNLQQRKFLASDPPSRHPGAMATSARGTHEGPEPAPQKLSKLLADVLSGVGPPLSRERPTRGLTECGRWLYRYGDDGAFYARPFVNRLQQP